MKLCEIQNGMPVYVTTRRAAGMVYDKLACANKVEVLLTKENTVLQCADYELEPSCTTLYNIGDSVVSRLGGGFQGIVTGYEIATNRVICMSVAYIGKPRERGLWACACEELCKVAQHFLFRLNFSYCINGLTIVHVVEGPCEQYKVLLVRGDNGKLFTVFPKYEMSFDELKALGIHKVDIQKM